MRHAARHAAVVLPLLFAAARAEERASEQDQFEDRMLTRAVEKAARAAKSDRLLWVRELTKEFPNRVSNPLKEEEYAVWFELVADKNGEWRKDGSASAGIRELFDRVVTRMELGPVPSIKRDEFLKYARHRLIPHNPPAEGKPAPDPNEDADRVFRVLDRDGDGVLEVEEMTTKLREGRRVVDADGNGRIDKDEFRGYFARRVTTATEAALAKPEQNGRGGDAKPAARPGKAPALPDWFVELDANKDGQIALHEWRKGGKPIELFQEMDLDGDGLLTKEEYQRYLKTQEPDPDPPGLPLPGTPVKK